MNSQRILLHPLKISSSPNNPYDEQHHSLFSTHCYKITLFHFTNIIINSKNSIHSQNTQKLITSQLIQKFNWIWRADLINQRVERIKVL